MKKFVFLILSLILCLTSCSNISSNEDKIYNHVIRVDGIENFKSPEGYYELNASILPSQDFLSQFKYINADYHFREHYESKWDFCGYEKSIIIIEYDASIYKKAKQFCLENMLLSVNYSLFYNGFVFIENLSLPIEANLSYGFPQYYNMFAYNDNLKCLVFMGYYNPDYTNKDAMSIIKNWAEFLEMYFGDVYNFDNQGTVL